LVIADSEFEGLAKTKEAVKLLQSVNAYNDIERVKDTRKIRVGRGKARNRRHVQKKGPLVIHNNERGNNKLALAMRNIPGIELCNVHRLNLLQLAPGGHLGRFIIWTEGAFKQLSKVFGSFKGVSQQKKHYTLPRSILTNPDISRIITSEEVKAVVRPAKRNTRRFVRKKNPLKNFDAMVRLNPYALTLRRRALLLAEKQKEERAKGVKAKRDPAQVKKDKAKLKKRKEMRSKFYTLLHTPAIAPERMLEEIAPKF